MIVGITILGVLAFVSAIMLWANSLRKPLIGWTSHNCTKGETRMIITFKSQGCIFEKERDGIKPNTVRIVDKSDERFEFLQKNTVAGIQIINKENPEESFVREIEDITFWGDLVVISWKHSSEKRRKAQ